ncbi:hypothetical protein JW777_01080 [bacterium]|nr:hypothetical protein [bacterium]
MTRPEMLDRSVTRTWLCLAAMVLFFTAPGALFPDIRIRPRIYAGGGYGRTLNARTPAFAVEDAADRNFVEANMSSLKRNFIRGQMRLDLVHAGAFSAGVLFWGHYNEISSDFPEYWLKPDKWYPASDHAALHAATVQWKPAFAASRRVAPFLLAGAGGYYGNVTSVRYLPADSTGFYYYGSRRQTASDAGRAVLTGIGVVAFRYAYFYAGAVHLFDAALPARTFFDVIVGVTF